MNDVNVISLTTSEDEDDDNFAQFIDEVKNGNKSAVFLLSRKDGTLAVGSTYKTRKDLVWDCQRLLMFMQELVQNGEE
jgi:hypothetical protein